MLIWRVAGLLGLLAVAGCSAEFPSCDSEHTTGLLAQLITPKVPVVQQLLLNGDKRQVVAARLRTISAGARNAVLAICDAPDLTMLDGFVKRSGEKPESCRTRITAQFDQMRPQHLDVTGRDYPEFTDEIIDVDAFVNKQEQLKQAALAAKPGYLLKDIVELVNNGMTRTISCKANVAFDMEGIGSKVVPIKYTVVNTGDNVFSLELTGLDEYRPRS